MRKWSDEAIAFAEAERRGQKLGVYEDWKHGLPGELWEIEVYEIDGKLFGGVRYMGKLEPMLQDKREEILEACREYAELNA